MEFSDTYTLLQATVLEDIFEIFDKDPDGKKFDKGRRRLHATLLHDILASSFMGVSTFCRQLMGIACRAQCLG